jgi:hypothetical protein
MDNINEMDNDELEFMFNDIDDIIENMDEEGELSDYLDDDNPLRLFINRMWHKKMQDLEKVYNIEDSRIREELESFSIDGATTKFTRNESNYGYDMERIASMKRLLVEVVKKNRIVPLEQFVKKMKINYKVNVRNLVELEKQLYKVKVGTLEGLTRDVIANKKVEVDEDTVAKDVLEQPYDEMKILFPNGPIGGKRRSSRKYRKNNKKNKTKSRKG